MSREDRSGGEYERITRTLYSSRSSAPYLYDRAAAYPSGLRTRHLGEFCEIISRNDCRYVLPPLPPLQLYYYRYHCIRPLARVRSIRRWIDVARGAVPAQCYAQRNPRGKNITTTLPVAVAGIFDLSRYAIIVIAVVVNVHVHRTYIMHGYASFDFPLPISSPTPVRGDHPSNARLLLQLLCTRTPSSSSSSCVWFVLYYHHYHHYYYFLPSSRKLLKTTPPRRIIHGFAAAAAAAVTRW